MAQNYTRQSSFSDGDTINASLFNDEYNQIVNAFSYSSSSASSTGHRHDGSSGQGGNIFRIGDLDFLNKIEVDDTNNRWGFYVEVSSAAVEQIRIQDGAIVPVTNNDIDLGTSSLEFKDLYIDGTANLDSLVLGSGSTVTSILDEDDLSSDSATSLATQQSIKAYVDAQVTAQDFDFSADTGGALSIDLDSEAMTFTGGTGIDTSGSGNVVTFAIDSTVATLTGSQTLTNKTLTSPDINGGTVDGATIATSDITVGATKTLDVSAGTLTLADNQISGDKVEGGTIAATTITDLTFGSLNDGVITVTAFVDEDNMASDSATLVPTQQSVKAYVDSQVTAQDLDLTTDSGTIAIDLDSETLTVSGGTGIDSSATGNAVTLAIDSTVATLTGTQTLTNKTLTSPTLNTPTIGTSFTIGAATITEAELEILDGATVTTAELNVLDGITSTTAELNILDGVTSTAAELNILDGVTSTTAELNILDGVTSTTAELNILDGVTATTAELNYVDGVTSAIQTQLDAKAPTASPTFTGTVTVPGLTTTADISFGDNDKAIFGAGSDLQIYHDGSNSYIDDQGTGRLRLRGAADIILAHPTNGETYATFSANGAVSLRYDDSIKLATTSTGIDVTGTAVTDGLTVDGNVSVASNLPRIILEENDTTDLNTAIRNNGGVLKIQTVNDAANSFTNRMDIDHSSGDVILYGDVGIGTSSPSRTLHIKDAVAGVRLEDSDDNSYGEILYNTGSNGLLIRSDEGNTSSGSNIIFEVDGTESARIDSSGNLLAGTTNTAPYASSTEGGMVFRNDFNLLGVSRQNNYSGSFNRYGTDGDILNFRKDGSTVGSIGIESAGFYIDGESGHAGLSFAGFAAIPRDNGARVDNAVDLGSTSHRFRNLYAAGGVFIGGTSSASYLDDYEEGTWTPGITTGTASFDFATYVKVGRLVNLTGRVTTFSNRTSSNAVIVTGIPYTPSGSQIAAGSSFSGYVNLSGYHGSAVPYIGTSGTSMFFYFNGDSNNYATVQHNHLTNSSAIIYFSISYYASA